MAIQTHLTVVYFVFVFVFFISSISPFWSKERIVINTPLNFLAPFYVCFVGKTERQRENGGSNGIDEENTSKAHRDGSLCSSHSLTPTLLRSPLSSRSAPPGTHIPTTFFSFVVFVSLFIDFMVSFSIRVRVWCYMTSSCVWLLSKFQKKILFCSSFHFQFFFLKQ